MQHVREYKEEKGQKKKGKQGKMGKLRRTFLGKQQKGRVQQK